MTGTAQPALYTVQLPSPMSETQQQKQKIMKH